MKPKYFYTQHAERPTLKFLDMYKNGTTQTIATYDTTTGTITAMYDKRNMKAIRAFVEYYKQWQE